MRTAWQVRWQPSIATMRRSCIAYSSVSMIRTAPTPTIFAVAYIAIARRDSAVAQAICGIRILRDYLIKMVSEGWTSSEEQTAIAYLQKL